MTVMEVLAQAKALSRDEQKELAKLLIDMADAPEVDAMPATPEATPEEHWGKNLVKMVNEMGDIDLIHPEIEDPVEWVKQIRREQDEQRGILHWDDEE